MSINRRKFIVNASKIAALSFSPFEKIIASKNNKMIPANFKIIVLATNWGFEGSLDTFCAKAKGEGYDGIEMWWPMLKKDQDELFNTLEKYKLSIGFLCGVGDEDPLLHVNSFKNMLDSLIKETKQKPLYVNCHSGKDYFSFDINSQIINFTTERARTSGITIYHETHRSRMLYAAPITKQFIEQHRDLRLTLDISHWCNVHESLLHDQKQTVAMALSRTGHIHARIGHQEGPQVNDPRAPEWETAVKAHFEWWDEVVARKIKEGASSMTFLTEFGPPHYMPTLPYTQKPVSNQWEINVHMMQVLRKRYQAS